MARDITRYERNLMKDMDHWFDSFFNTRKVPSVDIREGKDSYTIRASLAGYDEDAIKVYVEDHILHISGEEKEENKEKDKENKKYIVKERKVTSFERSFSLPENVDEGAIEASYDNGMLVVTIPKKAEAQARRIEVKIASPAEGEKA